LATSLNEWMAKVSESRPRTEEEIDLAFAELEELVYRKWQTENR